MGAAAYILITLFILLPAGVYWKAFVIVTLWAWFVVPAFEVPQLSIHTVGGMLFIVVLLQHLPYQSEEDKKAAVAKEWSDLLGRVVGRMFGPAAVSLGFGWVWKWLAIGM